MQEKVLASSIEKYHLTWTMMCLPLFLVYCNAAVLKHHAIAYRLEVWTRVVLQQSPILEDLSSSLLACMEMLLTPADPSRWTSVSCFHHWLYLRIEQVNELWHMLQQWRFFGGKKWCNKLGTSMPMSLSRSLLTGLYNPTPSQDNCSLLRKGITWPKFYRIVTMIKLAENIDG